MMKECIRPIVDNIISGRRKYNRPRLKYAMGARGRTVVEEGDGAVKTCTVGKNKDQRAMLLPDNGEPLKRRQPPSNYK